MILKRITDQTREIVEVEEVRIDRGLPDDFFDHDVLIHGLIKTARGFIETEMRGLVLMPQSWLQTEIEFNDKIELGLMPVSSIDSVSYLDDDGAEQTLSPSVYELDNSGGIAYMRLAYDQEWPDTLTRYDAVKITMTAGHASADDVPPQIKTACLLIVGHLYENREATTPIKLNELPFGVRAFISPYVMRRAN